MAATKRKSRARPATTARNTGKARAKAGKKRATARGSAGRKWSAGVMERSDALDLRAGIFTQASASAIARSLKKSADASHRRKASPFQSAMSMLNFEINRAGTTLSPARRRVLEQTKEELRKVFKRTG